MAEKKKLRKSKVWQHFKKFENTLEKICECLICGKQIRTSGNTTNLRSHIKTHNIDLDEDGISYSTIIEPEEESKNVINIGKCRVEVLDDFLVFPPSRYSEQDQEIIQEDSKESIKNDPLLQANIDLNSNSDNQRNSSDSDPLYSPNDEHYNGPKRKKKRNENNFANKLLKFNKVKNNVKVNNPAIRENTWRSKYIPENDDFDKIGEIVASRLRQLKKKMNARRCENEILTIILSYEIDEETS